MHKATRRQFLSTSAAAAAALAGTRVLGATSAIAGAQPAGVSRPWHQRTFRWMQTNIAEIDVTRYDIPWWRQHWKRTHTQGVVVNAGGIVAYYPTDIPLHRRSEFLGDRDLFGDLAKAAHDDGIVVFARMDSNGAGEATYRAHPAWFTRKADGQPYFRDGTLYAPCINGPYYREHIPAILREIAGRYRPEGFTDNSWSGLSRGSICYCANCRGLFKTASGFDLPTQRDWNAPAYRAWIEWSYASRLEIWDLYNAAAREAGGPECLWVGMIGGTLSGAATAFRDYREICGRSQMVMLDSQRRSDATGFQANGQTGKLVHGLLGWHKPAPESMALYQTAGTSFRLATRPEPEVRLWAAEGFAAGIQPWWHYVNAYHEDRRMYHTPLAMSDWYVANESFLHQRTPVATVGIVYSQRNYDFFGREHADVLVDLPQRGFTQALTRARIPYVLVHADNIERDAATLKTLILPNLAVMTDSQRAAIAGFVKRGGGLVATGASGLLDEWGDARPDFALAELFGVRLPAGHPLRNEGERQQWASGEAQSYLRITPELRAGVEGPHAAGEPPARGERHPVLKGFEETDILAYGGMLAPLDVSASSQVLLTFVPAFPAFPPEAVWSRQMTTDIAGLVITERAGAGRVAYVAADLDRRYARDNLVDLATLLANLVRWTAKDDIPIEVTGPGLIDCHLYRQPNRLILHCVNLTNEATWRGPAEELIPIGPIRVRVRVPEAARRRSLRLLVSPESPALTVDREWVSFTVHSILDHEVAIIEEQGNA
jgi:putative glycosyl hydrolase-like family 6 (GHL6) protein